MRTTKFIKGDRVKIVANLAGHQFDIGQEVVIAEANTNDNKAIDDKGNYWWIEDRDGVIIEPAPSMPDLLQSLITMTALCRIKYGNLDKDVYEEILKAEAVIQKAKGGQS